MAARRLTSVVVKQCSTTPLSHKRYNLSFIDQAYHDHYVPFAFFYPNTTRTNSSTSISQSLCDSLSKILASYYPLAGRIRDNAFVDCSGAGVEVVDARINHRMSEILVRRRNDDDDVESLVFPEGLPWRSLDGGNSMAVQLTHFDCGGLAIGVCISHKIADGFSATKFIRDWASVTRGGEFLTPQFVGGSVFPPLTNSSMVPNMSDPHQNLHSVAKRFLFSASKLKDLKARHLPQNPSRVEAMTALLYRCAVRAAAQPAGKLRPSMISVAVNLRFLNLLTIPPEAFGNFVSLVSVQTSLDEEATALPKLAGELRKAKEQFLSKCREMEASKIASLVLESIGERTQRANGGEVDMYRVSSLCKVSFDNVDFGWGRPTRVLVPSHHRMRNLFVLMDSQSGDNAIEAMVSLEERVMSAFQFDEELLQYALLL